MIGRFMALAAVGCTADPAPRTQTPAPVPVPAPAPTEPSLPVPLVDEALAMRCPDPTPRMPVVPEGDDLRRLTLAGAGRCNDGTPPVVYVRAASDPAHADDWVVQLEGGDDCSEREGCAERWCGEGPYDAGKMSTRWAPETRGGRGIGSEDDRSTFSGWNHAVLYYCTSDRFAGTVADQVLGVGEDVFRLHFQGSVVLRDAVDALTAGAVSDDGTEALPRLDDARTLVLAGSSAGGQATATNLDRVAGWLPGVEVVGVPDAMFYADVDVLAPADAAAITALVEQDHALARAAWAPLRDESCVVALGDGTACSDLGVVMRDHLTTPFLTHHDVEDPAIYRNYYSTMSNAAYAEAAVATYAAWEAAGRGSVYLTACGVHQYLPQDDRFLDFTTADADGGPARTMDQALSAFLGGVRPLYLADDATGSGSSCP